MVSSPPPVVFLGPSAKPEDILEMLPDAYVRPPVARGDLYHFRILKHSLFIVIDGIFSNQLAISPREVVDVINDGAVFVGISSMGALRAADCAPAGAIGLGQIYRLYRRRIISSEDEVAVVHNPELPHPSASTPLVNMRIVLRRAFRRGLISSQDCDQIITAAESMHFSERTWSSALENMQVEPSGDLLEFIRKTDPKREDVIRGISWVVKRLANCGLGEKKRTSGFTFGLTTEDRERAPDPTDGSDKEELLVAYSEWLLLTGQVRCVLNDARGFSDWFQDNDAMLTVEQCDQIWALSQESVLFEKTLATFQAFRRGYAEAVRLGIRVSPKDSFLAEIELADAHAFESWSSFLESLRDKPVFAHRMRSFCIQLAAVKALKRYLFCRTKSSRANGKGGAQWQRS